QFQACHYNQWMTSATTYNFGADSVGFLDENMGPNIDCPQQITPMTANSATILSGINSMKPLGDTQINIGLAWGWRLLSPNWQGQWADNEMATNSLPLAYDTPNMVKVVILMTDGTNYIGPGGYSAYGFFNSGSLGSGYNTGTCPVAGADDAPPGS